MNDKAGGFRGLRLVLLFLSFPVFLALLSGPASAQIPTDSAKPMALVIGNAKYKKPNFDPLNTALNDAKDFAETLRGLGFVVEHFENIGKEQLTTVLKTFADKAKLAPIRVVYFAGHGVQYRGKNYLIPVNEDISDTSDLKLKAPDVTYLLKQLGALEDGINIVILDACRNNPLITPADRKGADVVLHGSAPISSPKGTLVAFPTAAGMPSLDSTEASVDQEHSPYMSQLLRYIKEPGLPVELMFKLVRNGVLEVTAGVQEPWESTSLRGNFCFAGGCPK